MLEQTRLDYLQAMGVAQWMPRHDLPFAPESRWLATAASQSPQADAAPASDDYAVPTVEALLERTPVASSQPAQPTPAATPAPAPAQAAELDPARHITPNFQLFFVSSSLPVVWVCDNVEEVEALQRFIHSVQKGLQGQSNFVAQAFEFRWPFLQTRQQDQSLPVALQALTAHWQFMQQSNNAKSVVAIGPHSQQWLQQIETPQISAAQSVAELMYSAVLKRQLWQELLALL